MKLVLCIVVIFFVSDMFAQSAIKRQPTEETHSQNFTKSKKNEKRKSSTTYNKPVAKSSVTGSNSNSISEVYISCNVNNADIYIDDQYVGFPNRYYKLSKTLHKVAVKSPGYNEEIGYVNPASSERLEIFLSENVVCTNLRYNDGSTYVGYVKNGIPHGQGTYNLPNGMSLNGNWINGLLSGQCKISFKNGDYCIAYYKDNSMQTGNITFYCVHLNRTYNGYALDNNFHLVDANNKIIHFYGKREQTQGLGDPADIDPVMKDWNCHDYTESKVQKLNNRR